MGERLSKSERLAIVFHRLSDAPAAKTAHEAMATMNRILEEVEDEFSGVHKASHPGLASSERMYPAQADNILRDNQGSIVARSRRHSTTFGRDGSIIVMKRESATVVFKKAGA